MSKVYMSKKAYRFYRTFIHFRTTFSRIRMIDRSLRAATFGFRTPLIGLYFVVNCFRAVAIRFRTPLILFRSCIRSLLFHLIAVRIGLNDSRMGFVGGRGKGMIMVLRYDGMKKEGERAGWREGGNG